MELTTEETPQGIRIIRLNGRMDLRGSQEVDVPFAAHATTSRAFIVVDLSAVDFLASLGLRTLLSGAKGQRGRGGKLVLAGAQPLVGKVLASSGIQTLIPVYPTVEAAIEALAPLAGASPAAPAP